MPVKNATGVPVMEVRCQQCGARLQVKFLSLMRQSANRQTDEYDLRPTPLRRYRLMLMGMEYKLHEGMNTIGRLSDSSEASVQVVTGSRKMSRMHARINVSRSERESRVELSNWQNKNATIVNGVLLCDDDSVRLYHGDHLMMGDVEMIFEEY